MALGVSPQRLREVRFAEQWRGYRTDEVDAFVDRVAEAIDALERRLRDAVERAERAERALQERAPDERVSRTLVLAQRTADAALREAEAEAARLVDEATQRAREMVAKAEARAALQQSEMEARAESELHDLRERRRALEVDVALLADYVQGRRAALAEELRAQVHWLETGDHLPEPPVSGPWTPPARPAPGGAATPSALGIVRAGAPSRDQRGETAGDDRQAAPATGEEVVQDRFPPSDEASGDPVPAATPAGPGTLEHGHPGHVVAVADVTEADAVPDAPAPLGGAFSEEGVLVAPAPDGGDGGEGASVDDRAGSSAGPGGNDLDEIPWRGSQTPDPPDEAVSPPSASGSDDDPFIAELRRAVDDPEPLGPRDDDWFDDFDLGDPDEPLPGRRRRRRQR